ncbi:peptide chain release factor 2 [Peptoanaerobacter stomatis]|uniref:Peptide chain release factor 2 n=1 Tax=Peptoanaerobacter stomatis TaxID=796937 RepID=G9X0G8_9FIRM|nr:peptide chain release factor 2 [Peptoanaerobacter stomatis]EHL15409.1 peptide chain release factor 2 [Peptoanaerobacter stomatis]
MFLFDIDNLKKQDEILKEEINSQDFWNDRENAQKILKKSKQIQTKLESYNTASSKLEDLEVLFELATEDENLEEELIKEIDDVQADIKQLSLQVLLSGEYDANNAILSVHSGTGGLDAQDWTQMLLRMYTRFAQNMGFKIYYIDIQQDPEAGIKSATLHIEGDNAYGYLKCEKGVHRLVRISPFDSSGKRHTSFASVDVLPELDDSIKIDINPKDLKIDTYRSSGAGGQHVNKTESAIRITHIPTGVVVQCQNERSQFSNKDTAMKMLMAKLIELKELEHKDKIEDIQGKYSLIAWGSQIRSYVFQPYTMVKDHRTNFEIGNIISVMDGDIMPFINAYLINKEK